ncbi:NAD(P)-binding protein [Alteromonas mediterranea]|uniref:NAD(P)-binding protein n=1 Tax=Alteromonas mediterranea TaxID=314275 RepID=UPI0015E875BD|nr:FAD/NAD(P)-binding protein [Alteromonas mediterranea]
MRTKIAIIGGGLSGVYTAYLLEQQGITDYILLEARDQLGGRIMDFTSQSQVTTNSFYLGPTWFWPEFQPQLNAIIKTLNLETFAQYEQGDTSVERSHTQSPAAALGQWQKYTTH